MHRYFEFVVGAGSKPARGIDVPVVFKSRAGMEAGPYGLYEWQIGFGFL
ncbi:hypothetical protein KAR10_00245 [bacterium]|nr:hypothetical protein [bacterium]